MPQQDEFSGFYAHNCRGKVVKDASQVNRFTRLRVSHGFAKGRGDAKVWTNRFYTLMVGPDTIVGEGSPQEMDRLKRARSGDVIFFSGRMVEEERTYEGKKYDDRIVWVDSITYPQTQRQQPPSPPGSDDELGGGFPSEAGGMDDVPF